MEQTKTPGVPSEIATQLNDANASLSERQERIRPPLPAGVVMPSRPTELPAGIEVTQLPTVAETKKTILTIVDACCGYFGISRAEFDNTFDTSPNVVLTRRVVALVLKQQTNLKIYELTQVVGKQHASSGGVDWVRAQERRFKRDPVLRQHVLAVSAILAGSGPATVEPVGVDGRRRPDLVEQPLIALAQLLGCSPAELTEDGRSRPDLQLVRAVSAYVLWTDFGLTHVKIADLFRLSRPWVSEVVKRIQRQLAEGRGDIALLQARIKLALLRQTSL